MSPGVRSGLDPDCRSPIASRLPGVPPGTYTFALRAFNASGQQQSSNAVTLTFPGTCSPPATPTNFSASNSGNTIVLRPGHRRQAAPHRRATSSSVSGSIRGLVPSHGPHAVGRCRPGDVHDQCRRDEQLRDQRPNADEDDHDSVGVDASFLVRRQMVTRSSCSRARPRRCFLRAQRVDFADRCRRHHARHHARRSVDSLRVRGRRDAASRSAGARRRRFRSGDVGCAVDAASARQSLHGPAAPLARPARKRDAASVVRPHDTRGDSARARISHRGVCGISRTGSGSRIESGIRSLRRRPRRVIGREAQNGAAER